MERMIYLKIKKSHFIEVNPNQLPSCWKPWNLLEFIKISFLFEESQSKIPTSSNYIIYLCNSSNSPNQMLLSYLSLNNLFKTLWFNLEVTLLASHPVRNCLSMMITSSISSENLLFLQHLEHKDLAKI